MMQAAYQAPATVANFGPGFDSIGAAQTSPRGDVVIASRNNSIRGVRLAVIANESGLANLDLPYGQENVAEAVGQRVYDSAHGTGGIELKLIKRMKLETGLGSSGSSSVAAALAVNELLDAPLGKNDPRLLEAVVYGESVATRGLGHSDNVLPSLFGGFVFIDDQATYHHRRFEGDAFYFAIVSPDLAVNTGDARRALENAPYGIKGLVKFTALLLSEYLALGEFRNPGTLDLDQFVKTGGDQRKVLEYITGAHRLMKGIKNNDPMMLGFGASMDRIVTPVRAEFIRGFYDVKDSAFGAGAYGFTISGSGPSVISVTDSEDKAHNIGLASQKAFERNATKSEVYVSKVNNLGAKRI